MDYEQGLDALKQLARGTDWYTDFALQEARLRENLDRARRYGDYENLKAERAQIVEQLNLLVMQYCGISFTDLCLGRQPVVRAHLPVERRVTKNGQSNTLADVLTITMDHDGRPHKAGPAQWWVRLRVESRRPVRRLHARVYDIRRLANHDDQYGTPLPEFQDSILSWAKGKGLFAPISVQAGEVNYLDLAWRAHGAPQIPTDELRVASALDQGPRDTSLPAWGMRQDFIPLRPGVYRFVVRILAEGFESPLDMAYRLSWPGPGREDDILLAEESSTSCEQTGKSGEEITRPTPPYGTGHRWAVLVGVNYYEDEANYGRLHVCVKDVHAIHDQLIAGGFDPTRIRLLTDDTPELPTRDNILAALKAVADATEPNDLLLFYYSGHGDEDGGEPYLVARNGRRLVLRDTGVAISRVKEIIDQAPARAKVIVLDACHSGADIGGKGPRPMSEAFIRRVFEQAEGLVILASCKQGQFSYEWQARERSVFTHFLLEALEGRADWDGKGFVTIQDAHRYVVDGVKRWAVQRNVSQTPTLEGKLAGDLILTEYRSRRPAPAPSPNPFVPLTGRITDPDRVFDREREIEEALDCLRGGSSVALIGPAGVGKSSLLTRLIALVPERLGPAWETAYLNLQVVSDEEEFYEALCHAVKVATCRGYRLARALEGRRILLCLDEVEKMTWEGFTRGLRAELRGLADGDDAPLKLALTARTSLDNLFPDSEGEPSPLANICLEIGVGPWDEETARAFLLDRLRGTGVRFSENESASLLAQSEGHPQRLMRAAHRLYNERAGGAG